MNINLFSTGAKNFFMLVFVSLFSLSHAQALNEAIEKSGLKISDLKQTGQNLRRPEYKSTILNQSTGSFATLTPAKEENSQLRPSLSPMEQMRNKPEEEAKRDAFAKHYRNDDGTFTAIIGSAPLHYKKDGKWKDIDTKINKEFAGNYAFSNKANLMESYFGNSSSKGILSKTKEGEVKEFLNTKMYWEVNGQKVGEISGADVPAKMQGEKLYYNNLFGNIGAEYEILVGKRKLNYIIPDKAALGNIPSNADYLVFSEEIELPKGWSYENTNEGIVIKDQNSEEIYLFDQPVSIDAKSSMESEHNTVFETIINGNILLVKKKVKIEWLLSVQRVFPIMVDPTVTVYPTATGNYNTGSIDATGVKTANNDIYVGMRFAFGQTTGTRRFMRGWSTFNMTSIPAGSTLDSVLFGLYIGLNTLYATDAQIVRIGPITSGIPNTATGTTLYNMCAEAGTNNWFSIDAGVTGNASISLDATQISQIQGRLATGNFSFGFYPGGTYNTNYTEQVGIYGSNRPQQTSTGRPYMTIVYTEASSTPTCTTPIAPVNVATGIGQQGSLSWNAVGGATSYDVYFGTSATPPSVSNSQTGTTYTIPGCLLPNTTYYWKVVPKNSNGSATNCPTWSFTTDGKLIIYKNDFENANTGFFGTSGASVDGWYTNNNNGTGGTPTSGYNNTWTVGNGTYAITGKSVGVTGLNNGALGGSYFQIYEDIGEIHRWIYRPFDMTGLRDIEVNFKWRGGGANNQHYGSVISSINSGANYLMDTQGGLNADGHYWNSPNTIRTQSLILPSSRNNQANFVLGFKWDQWSNTTTISPSFVVDDIVIKACPYEGHINSNVVAQGVYEWIPSASTQTTLTIAGSHSCAQFQWQQSTDDGATWVNAVGGSGATTSSYTTPSNLTVNTWYRAKVYYGTSCPGVYQIDPFKIIMCKPINWANLQSPSTAEVCVGSPFTAYGKVYVSGVTPTAGHNGLDVQFGYSTTTSNPTTGSGWTWNTATWNNQQNNDDEYKYTFTAPAAGTYYYTFRYRTAASCKWYYGGYHSGAGGEWDGTTNVSGVLTVDKLTVAGTASASATGNICSGTTVTLTLADHVGNINWQSSTDGTNFNDISGATSATYTTPGLTSEIYYRAKLNSGNCAAANSNILHFKVDQPITFANLQWPANGNVCPGSVFTAYGQVYKSGVTEADGQGAGITAEFGYSLTNTNPNTWTNWYPATFNAQTGNNDEYKYDFTPPTNGTYYYTFRYKTGSCNYVYGGFDGGFWNGTSYKSGVLEAGQTTVYSSSGWTIPPTENLSAKITSAYSTSGAGLNVCSLWITNNATATIKAGSPVTVQNAITVDEGSNILVENNANLIQINDNAVNSGTITVKRNAIVPSTQYSYWSTPVEFIAGQNFKTIYPNIPTALYYNESNNFFGNSSGVNILGRGLAVKGPTSGGPNVTAQFIGKPFNGLAEYNLTYSGAQYGYHLVGNPYPSNIDLVTFYANNNTKIESTFQFWDNTHNEQWTQMGSAYPGDSYAKFNASGSTTSTPAGNNKDKSPGRYALVGQGFMVRALSAIASATDKKLVFRNNLRKSNAGVFYSKENNTIDDGKYWLRLTTPKNNFNTIAITYSAGANNGFEPFDSKQNNSADMFYSNSADNEKLAIQGRLSPFVNADEVPLGSKHFEAGLHKIELVETEGIFSNGQNIYLKDKHTGIVTNLSEGSYSFETNAGESTNRFEIIYKPETILSTDGNVKEELLVYRDGTDFVVKAQSKKITQIEVYDAGGRLITQIHPNNTVARVDALGMSNAMYILKIRQNETVTTKKVLR